MKRKKQYGFPDEVEIERVVKRMTQLDYQNSKSGKIYILRIVLVVVLVIAWFSCLFCVEEKG